MKWSQVLFIKRCIIHGSKIEVHYVGHVKPEVLNYEFLNKHKFNFWLETTQFFIFVNV